MPDSATKGGEFFGSWKIFSIYFEWQGVWDIQHHHCCLLLAELQAYMLCKHAEMGGLLSCADECVRLALGHQQNPALQGLEKGPSDALWSAQHCLPHHPVNCQVEEQH